MAHPDHANTPDRPPSYINGVRLFVGAACLAFTGCGSQLPTTPDAVELLTLRGHIYALGTPEAGEPMLSEATVTVEDADGRTRTAISNTAGFYLISVPVGVVSVSVSKVGYRTRISRFDMSIDTVLNFSLTAH